MISPDPFSFVLAAIAGLVCGIARVRFFAKHEPIEKPARRSFLASYAAVPFVTALLNLLFVLVVDAGRHTASDVPADLATLQLILIPAVLGYWIFIGALVGIPVTAAVCTLFAKPHEQPVE